MAGNIFNDACSSMEPMERLKDGYNKCFFSDGVLGPCKYHENRACSKIFTVTDGGGCATTPIDNDKWMSRLTPSEDLKRLIAGLSQGENFAGGWWLIAEQRDWLQAQLEKIFLSYKSDKRHRYIMVSGVAGYAHFYSYLKIVINAAEAVGFDLTRLHIDVIDSCITPILQIAHIEKGIRNKRFLCERSIKPSYNIIGYKLRLPACNRKFIRRMLPSIRKIHIRTFHCNILNIGDYCELMKKQYDIISEHFLLSMMENNEELIGRCRSSYQTMMKKNGHVLVATGLPAPRRDFYNKLIDIHRQYGFLVCEEDSCKVWDPYGIQKCDLDAISNDLIMENTTSQQVALDNALLHFSCING